MTCAISSFKPDNSCLLKLVEKDYIKSAHDVSLGGIITAISKMCIKGNKGIKLNKSKNFMSEIEYFFSELVIGSKVKIAPVRDAKIKNKEVAAAKLK